MSRPMRRLAAIVALPARPALDRRRGRPLLGGAADRGRRRGGPPRRLGRGLQAAEAPDPARARRRTRDALARRGGARRLPLPGRRTGPRRHDPRARRRARRLPRPRRLGPPRHRGAPRRRARAEGRRRHGDGRPPARAPRQPPCRRGRARARPRTTSATRAEAAYSLARAARALGLGAGADPRGDRAARPARRCRHAAATAPPRRLARRLALRLGRDVRGAAAALGRQAAPGGFDCSGFVWRVFKLEPFAGASALASVLRGRTTYEMSGRGAAGAADQEDREPAARRPDLPGREGSGVEARAGRPRGHLPRRRLVRPLVRERHHAPSARRVVPRPVRLGAATAARSGPRLAVEAGTDPVSGLWSVCGRGTSKEGRGPVGPRPSFVVSPRRTPRSSAAGSGSDPGRARTGLSSSARRRTSAASCGACTGARAERRPSTSSSQASR